MENGEGRRGAEEAGSSARDIPEGVNGDENFRRYTPWTERNLSLSNYKSI